MVHIAPCWESAERQNYFENTFELGSCVDIPAVAVMLFVQNPSANAPASFSLVSWECHSCPSSCYPFFFCCLFLMRHIIWTPVGHLFYWGRLSKGGAAALPAFNRDALTNRPRISLLDKVSFILTLHAPQRLCIEIKRAGKVNFWGLCVCVVCAQGVNSWQTVPGCALFDHA